MEPRGIQRLDRAQNEANAKIMGRERPQNQEVDYFAPYRSLLEDETSKRTLLGKFPDWEQLSEEEKLVRLASDPEIIQLFGGIRREEERR